METTGHSLMLIGFTLGLFIFGTLTTGAQSSQSAWMKDSQARLETELVQKYGEGERPRIQRGLAQVASFWRAGDGDAGQFEEFARTNFAGDPASLDIMFDRFEKVLEQMNGHMLEVKRAFRVQADLDLGPMQPFDETLAGYEPSAHIIDDFFNNKLAFTVLLNFPLATLEQKLADGEKWSRRQWAEARLADIFSKRLPAEVSLAIAAAGSEADQYISGYNIWMHHLLDDKGNRLFPPKMRLLSHWNLRDQLKADYADPEAGLQKQRMIQKVMERIVTQTIPRAVIDNPGVDWNPYTNEVKPAAVKDGEGRSAVKIQSSPEPDTRYATLLKTFHASIKADPYSPTAPTLIARSFNEGREIPEERVRAMLEQVASSPLVAEVAKIIKKRLGRPLESFDIWYNGFRQRGSYTEAQLDSIVSKKYPTADAFGRDIPNLLEKLGFSGERANYLASHIIVEPARGSGHAWGAGMRSEKAHLRTRVEKSGMNYKGFNIAVHEMGHNIEQIFSLNDVDHTLLEGVPNTAFTEALAFVFQGHDMELLGLTAPDAKSDAMKILNDFWGAYEISGVALLDMGIWHWMYDHPGATPTEVKQALMGISKEIWNKYYAPVFGEKDVVLLGIYSHIIDSFLYLPDYPIGHLIAFQIEEEMKKKGSIGAEFERMAKAGHVAPDLWMKNATGKPVGAEALLEAARAALKSI